MSKKILIVDDEQGIRVLIRGILEDEGYTVMDAGHANDALNLIENDTPDLAILDIWLEDSAIDGIEILKRTKALHPNLPVLMMSGHGTIETAVSTIKLGAYDFIEKPFKTGRLLVMIQRALEAAALQAENLTLKSESSGTKKVKTLSNDVIESLKNTLLSSSMKPLKDVLEWAFVMAHSDHDNIGSEHLPANLSKIQTSNTNIGQTPANDFIDLSLKEARDAFERNYLKTQLGRFDGNVSKTAAFIGMERSALHRKMKALDLSGAYPQDSNG